MFERHPFDRRFDPNLPCCSALRDLLAREYVTRERILRLLDEAGLRKDLVTFSGSAQDIWYSALQVASREHGRVRRLVAEASRSSVALADELTVVERGGWPRRYVLTVTADGPAASDPRPWALPGHELMLEQTICESRALEVLEGWLTESVRQPSDLLLVGWPSELEFESFTSSPLGELLQGAPIGGAVVLPRASPPPAQLWETAQELLLGLVPPWRASCQRLQIGDLSGVTIRPRRDRPADQDQRRAAELAARELQSLGLELYRHLAEILDEEPDPQRIAERLILCDLDDTLDVIDQMTDVVREQHAGRAVEVRSAFSRVLDHTLPYARNLEAAVQRVRDAMTSDGAARAELTLAGTTVLEMVMARHDVRRTRYMLRTRPPLSGESALQPPALLDPSVPLPHQEHTVVDTVSRLLQHELELADYDDLPARLRWIGKALQRASRPRSGRSAWYLVYEDSRSDATIGHNEAWRFLSETVQAHIPALRLIRLTGSGSDAEMEITLALQELHSEER